MTIASTPRRAGPYATNGVQTDFAFAFKVFDEADLRVVSSEDGIDADLALTTDYTVALNEDQDNAPGGTVSLLVAPDGPVINILSEMDIEQPVVITNRGGFFPRVFNDVFDRLTMYIQQFEEKFDRALLAPLDTTTVEGQYPVVLPGGGYGFSSGTGSDPALRGDLAATGADKGTALVKHRFAPLADILPVTPQEFGPAGLGLVDDKAWIDAAIAAAVADGRRLHFPDGVYRHDGMLEFGHPHLRITHGDVVFAPMHAGIAISFDGGADTTSVYGIEFGLGSMPTIQGNAGTTIAIRNRASHHARIRARVRDCALGLNDIFSVASEFEIAFSSNHGGWEILNPSAGVKIEKRAAAEASTMSTYRLIIEGIYGLGVDLVDAQHCNFYGTSEGNLVAGGGVRIGSNSNNNIFYNFFCEQNAAAPHWVIEGNDNIFLACAAGGASNSGTNTNTITGVRNLFLRGKWHNLTSGGYHNEFRQVALSGAYVANPNDIREKCHNGAGADIADNYPLPTLAAPVYSGLWEAQTANGERTPGYWKDRSGVVHLAGAVKAGASGSVIFTLPAGYRPEGTLYLPYDNVTAGIVGRLAVAENGQVQHLAGDTGTVSLAGISFLAEN